MTARLLTDFLINRYDSAIGFDTNHLDPHLASIFPRVVRTIDLSSTRGQMTLFDSLIEDDGVAKVVDLWHVSFERFFNQAEDIGLFEEMQSRNLKCFVLLHMDPKGRFAKELGKVRQRCPGADVILVENEWIAGLHDEPGSSTTFSVDRRRLFVPKLNPTTLSFLQQPEISVCRFVRVRVPSAVRAVQDQLGEALLPVFRQFEIIETATELGLSAGALLSRKRSPYV